MFLEKIEKSSEKKYTKFRITPGQNRIRILEGGDPTITHWVSDRGYTCFGQNEGCPFHDKGIRQSVKFATYVLDKTTKSDEIHLLFLPYSVVKEIDILQKSEDYMFENLPMPYDISIIYNPDAEPTGKYKVVPSPHKTSIDSSILEKLSQLKSTKEIINDIKKKAKADLAHVNPEI